MFYTLSTGAGAKYLEAGDAAQEEACRTADLCIAYTREECIDKLLFNEGADKENLKEQGEEEEGKREDKKRKHEEEEKEGANKKRKSNPLDSDAESGKNR